MKRVSPSLLALVLSLCAGVSQAQEWPDWRGPAYNGSSEETGLPVKFSPTEGVKWVADLPGPSAATPVVWGDSVFISSTEPNAKKLLAICLDRATGHVRWKHEAGSGYRPDGQGDPIQIDERSNYASPSPVTDGERVIFSYGNGDLLAYNFAGGLLWSRNIQKDYGDYCFNWTFGSSPQLFEKRLYFQVLQRDQSVSGRGKSGSPSFLLALDPTTGKELWRAERPSPAREESREAYTTPIPFVYHGRKEIVISGGDILSGHDAATGRELWSWGTWNPGHNQTSWRQVPSPCPGGDVVLGCAPKGSPVYAVKAGQSGELSEDGLAWKSEARGPVSSDVPTPLFYRGRFYVLSDVRKSLSCVQPSDGKVLWTIPTPGYAMCWGSPTGADGKIYLFSLRGQVHVVDAESGQLLATNTMSTEDSDLRSSIAVAHHCLFIRTSTKLYCVGN